MRKLQAHQVGNVTLAWSCTECSEIFHLGAPYETDLIPESIEAEFMVHDCQAQKRVLALRSMAKAAAAVQ
jgi:hypothetical protein